MSSAVTTAPKTGIAAAWPQPSVSRRAMRVDPGWLAVAVVAALAASPLAQGYFDFEVWGAMALALLVVLVVLLRVRRPVLSGPAAPAAAGLAVLLALSAASGLWAEAQDAAWTSTNRLTFYCAVFAIVLLAVRSTRIARLIMVLFGASALLASIWLCVSMLLGGAHGYFAARRLDWPISYVDANAGLLVMGLWPWVALAETARRSAARAGALGATSLIAGTAVLTQSRALIPATVAAMVLVLACAPGRTTRAVNLLIAAAAVGVSLTATLRVYSAGGAAARALPPAPGLLRDAAVAIVAAAFGTVTLRLGLTGLARRLDPGRRRRASRRLAVIMALVGMALVVGGGVVTAPAIDRQYHSFTSMRFDDAAPVRVLDASGYRYDLWRVAWREFERHPFVGLGAGNYDVEYYRLRRNPEYVLQPHSLELQMAAELGVGGLLALVLFAGGVAWACIARRGALVSGDRFVKLAAAGTFAAWLVGTSVDWLYDIPGLTGIAIVAGGLLVLRRESDDRRARPGVRPIWPVLGVGVIALLAAGIGRQYAATQYANAGTAKITRAPATALPELRRASALDPYSLTDAYALAAAYARVDDYSDARSTLLSAAAREPHNFVPPALLGDLAMRRGDTRVAAEAYASAVALDPFDASLRDALERARRAR